jgi:hypothetical protein
MNFPPSDSWRPWFVTPCGGGTLVQNSYATLEQQQWESDHTHAIAINANQALQSRAWERGYLNVIGYEHFAHNIEYKCPLFSNPVTNEYSLIKMTVRYILHVKEISTLPDDECSL